MNDWDGELDGVGEFYFKLSHLLSRCVARTAVSSPFTVNPCILSVELVAVFAMSLHLVAIAMPAFPRAVLHVVPIRSSEQMAGIHACAVVAMVTSENLRLNRRALFNGERGTAGSRYRTAKQNASIPISGISPTPRPAFFSGLDLDFLPEAGDFLRGCGVHNYFLFLCISSFRWLLRDSTG